MSSRPRRRLRRLRRYGKGSKLLEVGCGAGDFLHAVHRVGWDVKAVEYSDALADALRTELGFDVRTGDLAPGLWEHGTFDVVALWSVLEHLSNPLRGAGDDLLLSESRRGCRSSRYRPSTGCSRECNFAQYWALLDLPRHLSFFGQEGLSDLCDKAGMKLIVFKTPLLETAWCYFASICNYASHSANPCGGSLGTLIAHAAIGSYPFPLMAVRAWRGHGTEAFAVAVKR